MRTSAAVPPGARLSRRNISTAPRLARRDAGPPPSRRMAIAATRRWPDRCGVRSWPNVGGERFEESRCAAESSVPRSAPGTPAPARRRRPRRGPRAAPRLARPDPRVLMRRSISLRMSPIHPIWPQGLANNRPDRWQAGESGSIDESGQIPSALSLKRSRGGARPRGLRGHHAGSIQTGAVSRLARARASAAWPGRAPQILADLGAERHQGRARGRRRRTPGPGRLSCRRATAAISARPIFTAPIAASARSRSISPAPRPAHRQKARGALRTS